MDVKTCTRCIYDSNISNISFNSIGVCNYCDVNDKMISKYGTGNEKGLQALNELIEKIKISGRERKYDCIIGVSGGVDSSYLLLKAKEWGLRPLAVHYDNTWNSSISSLNIASITHYTNTDLFTHVADNEEIDTIKRAFLLSGVPEFDAETDLAFPQLLRKVAAKFKVKYILEGHSFVTEGISPVGGDIYYDDRYILDIVRKFSNLRNISSVPRYSVFQMLKWSMLYRQYFVRPLWYISYNKEAAQKFLEDSCGWKYYGGHHMENRASAFAHKIWHPERYETDFKFLTIGAKVRNNMISRSRGIEMMKDKNHLSMDLMNYVAVRTGLEVGELKNLIYSNHKRDWRDFKTNRSIFKRLRFLFYILARSGRVPMTFYLKYCKA